MRIYAWIFDKSPFKIINSTFIQQIPKKNTLNSQNIEPVFQTKLQFVKKRRRGHTIGYMYPKL